MSKNRRGFTLIEISLFLVLTAALFVGVATGTHNSIYQQRYNDSVQNFVEFLRSAYSRTSNVENQGEGRSNYAIYGKLITFGERYDLAGEDNKEKGAIFTYDVIGKVGDIGTGTALGALAALDANVVLYDEDQRFYSTGITDSYTLKWNAELEPECGDVSCSYDDFQGSILIVRHPRSGTVYTYFYDETIQVNELTRERNKVINDAKNAISGAEAQKAQAETDKQAAEERETSAQNRINAAQTEYNNARAAYNHATTQEEREAAQARMSAAQSERDNANAEKSAATAEKNTATNRITAASSTIANANLTIANAMSADNNPLVGELGNFEAKPINFCVNPKSGEETRLRQNVKIEQGARNGSGVSIIAIDSDENKCSK